MDHRRNRNRNYLSEKTSILGYVQYFLQKIDLFGRPITFTFENRNSFNSNIGGIFTILLVLGLLALFVSEMINVFGRQKQVITTTTNRVNIIDNPEDMNLGMDPRFNFAFSILYK